LGGTQYVLDLEQFFLDTLLTAYNEQRGMTGELYLCTYEGKITSPLNAYSKPLVLMIDDFSTSAGDLFPATMQDNKRGKLVGYRSNGAGGSVVEYSAGWYSETSTSVTESLMLRLEEREYPGLPKSRFIENVGVQPDVELDYMTRLNLLSNGRDFVAAFTKILVDEINAIRP
jgi:C-terminal processing protease CtpA/Prc